MTIEKEPFTRYHDEKKADTFTVKLNDQERAILEQSKKRLEQLKDSTALKQLAWIGAKVILSQETAELLDIVFNNKRKNQRLGIIDFEG